MPSNPCLPGHVLVLREQAGNKVHDIEKATIPIENPLFEPIVRQASSGLGWGHAGSEIKCFNPLCPKQYPTSKKQLSQLKIQCLNPQCAKQVLGWDGAMPVQKSSVSTYCVPSNSCPTKHDKIVVKRTSKQRPGHSKLNNRD